MAPTRKTTLLLQAILSSKMPTLLLCTHSSAQAKMHMGNFVSIELKSFKVLDKQRAMRALVAERLTHGSLLPLNRADFRRVRKPTIRDAHMTEQLERKQRTDRERRAKHKHVEQLSVITSHGRDLLA